MRRSCGCCRIWWSLGGGRGRGFMGLGRGRRRSVSSQLLAFVASRVRVVFSSSPRIFAKSWSSSGPLLERNEDVQSDLRLLSPEEKEKSTRRGRSLAKLTRLGLPSRSSQFRSRRRPSSSLGSLGKLRSLLHLRSSSTILRW